MEVKAANTQVSNALHAVFVGKGFFVIMTEYESLGFPLFCSQLSTLPTYWTPNVTINVITSHTRLNLHQCQIKMPLIAISSLPPNI